LVIGEITFYRDVDREPLQLDIHHLCTLFQRELSQTLVRISPVREIAPRVKRKASSGD
jgi:hypothetical protein